MLFKKGVGLAEAWRIKVAEFVLLLGGSLKWNKLMGSSYNSNLLLELSSTRITSNKCKKLNGK